MKNFFLRKPVSAFEQDMMQSGLRRVLGKWGLTALGVGAIIGAGIFVMTGVGAKEHAGPALALSFVVAGIGCTFAALCYAEFASFLPVEGSAYAYSYATMGELFAWIIGWDLVLEYAMGASAVAVGWSGYMGKFLHLFDISLPIWLMHDYATAMDKLAHATQMTYVSDMLAQGMDVGAIQAAMAERNMGDLVRDFSTTEQLQVLTSGSTLADLNRQYSSLELPAIAGMRFAANIPAFIIVWLVTALLIRGIREAASTNNLMVVVKVAVVVFIIIAGAYFVDYANWTPFIPDRSIYKDALGNTHTAYGWEGIIAGAAYIFFAYIGFDTVSTQAGEAKRPQRDVPFGIIASLVVCTVLYIGVALVLTGMVNYRDIDLNAPIAAAFQKVGLNYAVTIISIAAIAGLTSVLIVMLLGQSRVFYAISKDGLLPKKLFGELHPKFHTPYKTSLMTGLAVSIVSAFTPIDTIAKMVNIGTLLAFVMVCMAVLVMRHREPTRHRPFKVPYIWAIAPLGIIFNLGMMMYLGWENWLRLALWLGFGVVIYLLYGYRHSRLRNEQMGLVREDERRREEE